MSTTLTETATTYDKTYLLLYQHKCISEGLMHVAASIAGPMDRSSTNSGNKCRLARPLTLPNFVALQQEICEISAVKNLCSRKSSSSSSSSVIVSPHSRITTMGGVRTAQGVWRSSAWNAVMVSELTQASEREFHSGTVLTKNECLYWAVCDRICLNLKLWWCLAVGSAGSKMASAWTGILH